MNTKILNRLCEMFTSSPQLMTDEKLLQQAVNGTFGVDIDSLKFTTLIELTNEI